MDIDEISAWINAILDAQVELWDELPTEERGEAWGFLGMWKDELIEAAWNVEF